MEKGECEVHIEKKTLRNIFLVAAGCIVLYWLLHEEERVMSLWNTVSGILSPFVAGAALAFVLNVPMRAFERLLNDIKSLGLRRTIAVILTFIAFVLVLALVFWLLIPQISQTVQTLIPKLTAFFLRMEENLRQFLNDNPQLMGLIGSKIDLENLDWATLIEKAMTVMGNSLTVIADSAFSAVGSITGALVDAVISFVFALYCLFRKEILARQGRRLIYSFLPEKISDGIIRILRMTNSAFSNFISGQCLEACILGCLFAIVMSILRMPYVPLISVLVAITAFVPLVGAFVGCGLGAFFILVDSPVQAITFVIMFLVIQQVEGNTIYPRVVGTSIGLPGMWVLVAVTIGGDLMGVGGMLIMIPLASVAYALMREITNKRLADRNIPEEKLQDQPPEIRSRFREKREKKRKMRLMKKMQSLAEKRAQNQNKK